MQDNSTGTMGRSAEYADGRTHQDMQTSAGADNTRRDETRDMISADKVEGTAVYNGAGDRIGTIDSIMIGKRSGKVAYAVMSFGGFLGIGERYHPLPWDVLSYDEVQGGYNVHNSADNLRAAPSYSRDELERAEYGREVDDYYGGAGRVAASPTLGSSAPLGR